MEKTKFGNRTPEQAIRDTVRALIRAGAKDAAECEGIAVKALRDLCRLTTRQAVRYWLKYARA